MAEKNESTNGQYPYIKLFQEEYLGGSLHYGCTLEEQGFYVALLCLAAKNRKERGTLSLEKGSPMTTPMIANALFISEDDCQRLSAKMEEQERIHYRKDGVMVITNFDFYQTRYRRSNFKKEEARRVVIAKSDEKRLRELANKYPDIILDVLQTDYGFDVLNKTTGEFIEKIVINKESKG